MEIEDHANAQPELDRVGRHADHPHPPGITPQDVGTQIRSLSKVILVVAVGAALFALTALVVGRAAGQSAGQLVDDVYELSGSRLTGVLTMVGVMLLVAASAVCMFTARMTWTAADWRPWARFLLGAGAVTALLAIDDYFSIHEFPGEALSTATGSGANGAIKNLLEAGVLGIYVLLLMVLLWRYRSLVAATENSSLYAVSGVA